MKKKKHRVIRLLPVVFVVTLTIVTIGFLTQEKVQPGDTVLVDYVGMFANGTIFDKNTISFVVGAGELISGFENTVVGMVPGEVKTVKLLPNEAYGEYNKTLIIPSPLVTTISKQFNVSNDTFFLMFNSSPLPDKTYTSSTLPIPVKVVSVKNKSVELEYMLEESINIETSIGVMTLTPSGENITMILQPIIGKRISTPFGVGTIIDYNETTMLVDFNHPLAGKTLMFKIKLISIIHNTTD